MTMVYLLEIGMNPRRKTIGIIGLGAFGIFMAKHLSPYYRVVGYDPRATTPDSADTPPADLEPVSADEAAKQDIVVFAVPLAALEEAARRAAAHIRPGALVVDVTSVKVRPLEILTKIIPAHADLLGTHPLFGPQSGKNGITGLRVALAPVRIAPDRYYGICDFLSDKLGLLTLKVDPDAHDREMAKVQAMTHFMSRALRAIGLGPSPMATKAYEKLQEFASIVLSDSWDLFLTIENGNPHAAAIRKRLVEELVGLEEQLEQNGAGSEVA